LMWPPHVPWAHALTSWPSPLANAHDSRAAAGAPGTAWLMGYMHIAPACCACWAGGLLRPFNLSTARLASTGNRSVFFVSGHHARRHPMFAGIGLRSAQHAVKPICLGSSCTLLAREGVRCSCCRAGETWWTGYHLARPPPNWAGLCCTKPRGMGLRPFLHHAISHLKERVHCPPQEKNALPAVLRRPLKLIRPPAALLQGCPAHAHSCWALGLLCRKIQTPGAACPCLPARTTPPACAHTHAHTWTRKRACMHMQACALTRVHAYARARKHMNTHMPHAINTFMQVCGWEAHGRSDPDPGTGPRPPRAVCTHGAAGRGVLVVRQAHALSCSSPPHFKY